MKKENSKIAKATDSLQIKGHKAIARVIKHTNSDSPVARTVIIQNSPEAHKAFGVRNVPKNVLRKFPRKIVPIIGTPSIQQTSKVKNTKKVMNTLADQNVDVKENEIVVKLETPPKTAVNSPTATDIVRVNQESTFNPKNMQTSTIGAVIIT